MKHVRFGMRLLLALCASALPLAAQQPHYVGVNVNSFQNFDAAQQDAIVQQLVSSGVHGVRTSLRLDDKNIRLAKELQQKGIRLVLNIGLAYADGAVERPADPVTKMRAAYPLSAADPEKSRAAFQVIFDKLDANGLTPAAIELGNELNWTDFNGDFPGHGRGKAFSLADLSQDPEAQQVARGYLVYLKALAALKDVRDRSRLNRRTPIITAGMAAVLGEAWQQKLGVDGVAIPATYAFMRAHGLDDLVDGYGVHGAGMEVKAGDAAAAAKRTATLDNRIFPPGNRKPYWLTEWAIASTANTSAQDQDRARSVAELRAYFDKLFAQGRLAGIYWYVWNEPDRASIYRGGMLMEAGRLAVAPEAAR